ncbi:MAG: MBL fold metallo-hydrolase [Methanospirillum sp.]|nr:MBL fold metallo-hydrolase [Methanospirillum sp.]
MVLFSVVTVFADDVADNQDSEGQTGYPGETTGDNTSLQTTIQDISDDDSARQYRQSPVITGPDAEKCRTRLVLLGTTGGVSWWPETNRTSSSSALVVGDRIYLIDMGQGSASRISEEFNSGSFVDSPGGRIEDGSSTFLENVKALFFTHLHQDHTADYPSLLLIGPGAGMGTYTDPSTNKTVIDPLKVIGPCNRGELDADMTNFTSRGGEVIYTDSADPDQITPTPGIRQMTNIIWQAYAQTINDITLDDGYPDFRSLIEVREIGGTGSGDIPLPVSVPDPNNGTCPAMDPFEVYQDDQVRVTATLVDHHQVYPSFAYRFDTDDGSVVFSGDTGPNTSGNLQKLADGADILVHEVIDKAWIEQKFGTPVPGSQMDALKTHMLESHTANDLVGQVATECHVNTLVLNHIVPGNTPDAHLMEAKANFTGDLIIGEDLMRIGLGSQE